jgi:nucleolar protein 12
MSLLESIFGVTKHELSSSSSGELLFSTNIDLVASIQRKHDTNEEKWVKDENRHTNAVDERRTPTEMSSSIGNTWQLDSNESDVIEMTEDTTTATTAATTTSADDRTIFVGNLPVATTRKSLFKLFRECGKIESTRIRSVAVAGIKVPQNQAGNQDLVRKVCANTGILDLSHQQCVQGYVVFSSMQSIPIALQLNGTPVDDNGAFIPGVSKDHCLIDNVNTRRIRVDYVNPTCDPSRTVFIGNLPYQADETTLHHHCMESTACSPDDIEGIRVIRDKMTFQCKGFAYVLWRDAALAAAALRSLPNTLYLDRPIRVQVCSKKYKTSSKHLERKSTATVKTLHSTSGEHVEFLSSHNKPKISEKSMHEYDKGVESPPSLPARSAVGALRRVLEKSTKTAGNSTNTMKHRPRGDPKKNTNKNLPAKRSGTALLGSRRAVIEAKVEKRVKKLEKRVKKGMGKNKTK